MKLYRGDYDERAKDYDFTEVVLVPIDWCETHDQPVYFWPDDEAEGLIGLREECWRAVWTPDDLDELCRQEDPPTHFHIPTEGVSDDK